MIAMNTPIQTVSAGPAQPLLGPTGRCDACGALAQILVVLHTGGELTFCGHHGRTHRVALEEIAVYLETTTDRTQSA